ncbi:aspartyl-phosphate phosphatase Spo0E family protein [Paenibacillus medicaginis]|uniref:Aspartyl-phosphate phosphatase Spo0E family protein n=1 Tax=Paenibacillus medicaginis TaxID=1470560 RepID=A0ABV5C0H1_9BACL
MPDKKIEKFREIMYQLADEKGLNHPEVLAISQMIDKLLNISQQAAQIHIEERGELFALVLRRGKDRLELGEYGTYDEAEEWALKLSEQTEKPKAGVYYHAKRIDT